MNLIWMLLIAGGLFAVWLVLFGINYDRKIRIIERRAQGNEILRDRFRNAARRVDAGYNIPKPPQPLTKKSLPEDRARWLLWHLLTKAQWQQYNEYGWFHAGWYKDWPIFIGDGNVIWGVRRYCIYPISIAGKVIPRADVLIAQLLHARTNPRKLIRKAYRIN